jgi:hypothetical protein
MNILIINIFYSKVYYCLLILSIDNLSPVIIRLDKERKVRLKLILVESAIKNY